MEADVEFQVDGAPVALVVDTRTTVLDALRERGGNTSPKKGCDHGQCGACTVLVDGRRVLSCLTLAVTVQGAEITTAAGLPEELGTAFIEHDGFQCGYCTPGQLCSAAGMLDEAARGWPSHATAQVSTTPRLDRAEIAERMSGNLCRCGAYNGIVAAIEQVAGARL